jgi:hypothetical protein
MAFDAGSASGSISSGKGENDAHEEEKGSGLAITHWPWSSCRHGPSAPLAFAHAVHHVTSRGNARQDIVTDDDDRRRFLAKNKRGWESF